MTPPPSNATAAPGQSFHSFPNGVVRIDDTLPAEWQGRFEQNFLPALTRFEFGSKEWAKFLDLFRDSQFNLQARFHEAKVVIKKAPDLRIHEGAGVCVTGNTHDGKIAIPSPVGLGGFTAWGGLLDFCYIDKNKKGQVILHECPCALPIDKDITEEILKTPLGVLFPDGKIDPVPLGDLSKIKVPSGTTGGGMGEVILNALDAITLKAKIPSDIWVDDPAGTPQGSCHPLWAGLELFLDFPVLKNTIEKELYRQLDFSGVKKGSFLNWPRFDLANFPWPPSLQIPEGRADISVRYHPDTKTTEIEIKNIDAKVLLPDLSGKEPVYLKGGVAASLRADGSYSLHFDHLKIETEAFPSPDQKALRFKTSLNGDVMLKRDAASGLRVEEIHLDLDDLELKTLEGKGIQIGNQALGGELQGNLHVDYLPADPAEALRLSGSLSGGLWIEKGETVMDLSYFRVDLDGGFRRLQDRWSGSSRWAPNLNDFDLTIDADLAVKGKDKKEIFSAQGLWLDLTGTESWEKDGILHQNAVLEGGVEQVSVGKLSLHPNISINLSSQVQGDRFEMEGDGELNLESKALPLKIGSNLHFKTDLQKTEWGILIGPEQILGDLRTDGALEIKGSAEKISNLSQLFDRFTIKTPKPLLFRDGKKVLLRNVTVQGGGRPQGQWVTVKIPSLANLGATQLTLRHGAGSDRLFGDYKIQPQPVMGSSEFSIQDILFSGNFSTPPLLDFFQKPRVFTKAKAQAQLQGTLSGPLRATVEGSLIYNTEKNHVYLWINPQKHSELKIGPLDIAGEKARLEGKANLQGTWVGVLGKHGIGVGGGGVGLNHGEMFLDLNPAVENDHSKIPIFTDLSIVADQLWNIRRGIAYAGGDGIKIDFKLDPQALEGKVSTDSGKRHVVYILDQLPLSLPGYWKLFKKMQAEMEKSGGNP